MLAPRKKRFASRHAAGKGRTARKKGPPETERFDGCVLFFLWPDSRCGGKMKIPVKVRYRLWLECGEEYVFGNGVCALLLGVDRLGSLKKAAESLNMPYRGAWGRIHKAEEALGMALLDRPSDRQKGVTLTEDGRRFVEFFQSLDRLCRGHIEKSLAELPLECLEIDGVGH